MLESQTHCPTCSVRVPAGTGKFCPACGEAMDAAPGRAMAPTEDHRAMPAPGQPVGGPLDPTNASGPVGGPLDPSTRRVGGGASGYLEVEEAPMGLPLGLAAAGALVGALLWAGIAYATGMEIGYVAWILGGLVGGGCVLGGGRGPVLAAAAAGLAFVGMVGGRVYGTQLLIDEQVEMFASGMTRESFEQMRASARAMAQQDFFASPAGEALLAEHDVEFTDEDLAEMRRLQDELVAQFNSPSFTYERWREEAITDIRAQISLWEVLKETVGLIDVLFVLLGLSTAYGLVAKASNRSLV